MRPPGMFRWLEFALSETFRLIDATSDAGCGVCRWTVTATKRETTKTRVLRVFVVSPLLRQFLADILFLAPVLDALRPVHRALADHLHLQEVEDAFHLAHLQRRRRIGHLEVLGFEV